MDAHYCCGLFDYFSEAAADMTGCSPVFSWLPCAAGKISFWRRCPDPAVQDLQVDAAIDLKMLPQWLTAMLLLERIQLRKVDQVTTVSNGMLRRLQAKGRTKNQSAVAKLGRLRRHWPRRPWCDRGYRDHLNQQTMTALFFIQGLGKSRLDDLSQQ